MYNLPQTDFGDQESIAQLDNSTVVKQKHGLPVPYVVHKHHKKQERSLDHHFASCPEREINWLLSPVSFVTRKGEKWTKTRKLQMASKINHISCTHKKSGLNAASSKRRGSPSGGVENRGEDRREIL